jgi:hypothetical protein
MSFQDEIERTPGKVIEGPGYAIKVCPGVGTIRYMRAGRSIFLSAELVDRTREFGRSWLILPTFALAITTPKALRCHDGAQLNHEESDQVREQIASALNQIGQKYFFEIDEQQAEG